jgi:uncharacterized protein YigE (DUF2233 family)
VLLCLGACDGEREQTGPALPLETVAPEPGCRPELFEGASFTVCAYDARRERLELFDGINLRSLAALERSLGPRASTVKFAMNAGMYDEEGRPIGLFVAEGKEKKRLNLRSGSGNFHLLPNGVFAVDQRGRPSATPSRTFRRQVKNPHWATQSGPMLLIDGKLHPKFDADGPSQLIRNGVGVRDENTAFFAISEEPVSFGRFARLFRDRLGCRNALYLDGSVSSLWDPRGQRLDVGAELGPMLVVFDGAPKQASSISNPAPERSR